MIALHYYGNHPETVKAAWLSAVLNRVPFESITEERGRWVFKLYAYNGLISLSSFQMEVFLHNLGEEAKYIHFFYC